MLNITFGALSSRSRSSWSRCRIVLRLWLQINQNDAGLCGPGSATMKKTAPTLRLVFVHFETFDMAGVGASLLFLYTEFSMLLSKYRDSQSYPV
jgi:hypothetical protein